MDESTYNLPTISRPDPSVSNRCRLSQRCLSCGGQLFGDSGDRPWRGRDDGVNAEMERELPFWKRACKDRQAPGARVHRAAQRSAWRDGWPISS